LVRLRVRAERAAATVIPPPAVRTRSPVALLVIAALTLRSLKACKVRLWLVLQLMGAATVMSPTPAAWVPRPSDTPVLDTPEALVWIVTSDEFRASVRVETEPPSMVR